MTKNNTVPAALANTAEAEVKALVDYLATNDGKFQMTCLASDLADAQEHADLDTLVSSLQPDEAAPEVVGHLFQLLDRAEGALMAARHIIEGYLDRLGVREALLTAARALHAEESAELRSALRYGLDLCSQSHERLSKDLRAALVALGMPEKYRGRTTATYAMAWLSRDTWLGARGA